MIARTLAAICAFVGICVFSVAQEACNQVALDAIDLARSEYSGDIEALFSEIDFIRADWNACNNSEVPTGVRVDEREETIELPPSEVVDGGHIVEGLWEIQEERINSDACRERRKREDDNFYEDVYYDDAGLLVWDAGNSFSNFTFEYLLAQRYTADESGTNWVYERQITLATETTLSGNYAAYWQGNKDVWCTVYGNFTGKLIDTENACLVDGNANIRTDPSTKSPKNGVINEHRRVLEKVPGDDGFYWWRLSDDEYVREDVVTASRSCSRLSS